MFDSSFIKAEEYIFGEILESEFQGTLVYK